eukprot:3005559-Amphidinium_carterae.1
MGHALAVTRDVLLPSQHAIGVSNGPAKLAEAVSQHTLDHPSWPVTQLDMSNAYGSLKRQAVLDAIAAHALPHSQYL